ncbi:MAG: hypothetical protein ACLFVU_09705 [Phycisphaerae bacterium]
MRILPISKLDAAELEPHQRLFVELWYGMTHQNSLDSYRVRCLNAHGIVRELDWELDAGLVNDTELKALCEEAAEILSADPVILEFFAAQWSIVKPMLADPPKVPKGGDVASGPWSRLRFAIRDMLMALQARYFRGLCEALPKAVSPGNDNQIGILVGALLSELIAQGWPLSTLFRWHLHFLKPSDESDYSFEQNLDFMLRQLQRGPQPFMVTIRLWGSKTLVGVEKFEDFRLASEFTLAEAEKKRVRGGDASKFLRAREKVVFATTKVEAQDEMSAAILARTAAENLLDLFRFEFEPQPVRVERHCLVRRQGDGRLWLLELRNTVPNPRLNCELDDFHDLARQVGEVATRDDLDAGSQQQLQAAIRQYRFGRDAEGYRDKFMAWWMGLEALTSVGSGTSIGGKVIKNASHALLCDYLHRVLRDLLGTLRHIEVNWPSDLAGVSGCAELGQLTVRGLVQVLTSETHVGKLWDQVADHATIVHRGKQLAALLADAGRLRERLEQHHRHLRWHLSRLYRIRCCIVHGSPVRFSLPLYAANIEFYLKETIRFVLLGFGRHAHIRSIGELYERAAFRHERVLAALRDGGTDPIHEAVFADIVVRESGA